MIIRRDDAFMTVCELRTQIDANRVTVGTGMFVSSPVDENRIRGWIVTANHVAKVTNDKTDIVISTKESKAEMLSLKLFGSLSEWKHHPTADISVLPILFSPVNQQFMEGRFFPYDHFNLEKKVVSRDFELTSMGFPNGLGTEGFFSPFTFRSYASSGFVTFPRFDTSVNCTFFCLENPSVGGYSGGPVFDIGYSTNGVVATSKGQTICHGIIHGTMVDETGGKIAAVTPAFYLRDLIEET